MDSFGWSAGPLGGAGDDLNLLGGPLLDVDDKTLQVTHLCSGWGM